MERRLWAPSEREYNLVNTNDVIKDHLIEEMQKKLEETQKKMIDFMERAQGEIKKLTIENLDLKKYVKNLEEKSQFILRSPLEGFGFYNGDDSDYVRRHHDEAAVRKVLKAMAAGLPTFNLKFCGNFEVSEAGWTIRNQTRHKSSGGDGQFWKMWITFNGKRVDFETDADDISIYDGKSYNSAKKLTPDESGMVKLEGENQYVRWNITVKK